MRPRGATDKEEERRGIEATLNNLTIDMAGIEEDVVEQLAVVLEMEFEDTG